MILHISNNYVFNDIYQQITNILSRTKHQIVLCPLSIGDKTNYHVSVKKAPNCKHLFPRIIKFTDRISYKRRISKIYNYFVSTEIDYKNYVNHIHAHTLFSDGGVAYLIHKKSKIDYTVTVRNSDLNYWYKYRWDAWHYGYQILLHAKVILFLSDAYKDRLLNNIIPNTLARIIEQRCKVIVNGINPFWFKNIPLPHEDKLLNNQLIFVGDININKNLITVIKAIKYLNMKGKLFYLTIVGEIKNNWYYLLIRILAKPVIDRVNYYGPIKDRKELLDLYSKSHLLIMVSKNETFGLVYAEALSQGVAVIYSKGQGFDGQNLDQRVGQGVPSNNYHKLAEAIIDLANIADSEMCIQQSEKYNWENIVPVIAAQYSKSF